MEPLTQDPLHRAPASAGTPADAPVRAALSGAGDRPALLLVAGRGARASGWAPHAAAELADAAAADGRAVVLADLDMRESALHEHLGVDNGEGMADVVLFGVSVRRAALPVPGRRFSLVPAGFGDPDAPDLFDNPHWDVVLAETARARALLLLYAPDDAPGLADLAARVGRAVVLAAPGDEARRALPGGCEVAAVLHPPEAEAAAEGQAGEPVDAAEGAEGTGNREQGTAGDGTVFPSAVPLTADEIESGEADAGALVPAGESAVEHEGPVDGPAVAGPVPQAVREYGRVPISGARYSVPRLPERHEWMVRAIAVLTLGFGTYYIAWRWTASLNPDALWFAIPLALAETWGLLTAFIMVHSVWRLNHRTPPPTPPGLDVDVFITAYDEPLEVIRRTAVGARAIRYPHRTWILDDGARDEVRAMADELGVRYLRRQGNEHAKAGNLNHGLAHTRGEFVLQLDADHVPLPHILDRLLGFLAADPRLAFVQSPQDFYNTDAFTYEVNEPWRRIWEEQRLFFSVIQPGKDSRNAAFFCGSCALFRRAALEDVGGFATGSITEDIETSLRLHARGWRSAYYGESLAYGLAAGSAAAFHVQHLRWGQGAMQVLRRSNPLTTRGLSASQRISYFGSLTAYVGGVQKLVFYAAPIVFFLTGTLPIRAVDRDFLLRFLPFLLLSFATTELVARGTANAWVTERYQMAKFWTYTRAVASFFFRRPLGFRVTPKGPGHVPFRTYAPHVVLMGVTVFAVAWAAAAQGLGWMDYGVDGWRSAAFRANFLWAALNFALAAAVVRLSLRVRQQRADHRFPDHFPLTIRMQRRGEAPRQVMALSEDLNPRGIAFRSRERVEPGTRIRITLPLTTGTVQVRGRVVRVDAVPDAAAPMYRAGVQFLNVPLAVRDAIELHCVQHAVPLRHETFRDPVPLLSRNVAWTRNARGERRTDVRLPARVWMRRASGGRGTAMALLAEISPGGARLVMDEPVAPGTLMRFRVPGTDIRGTGRAVFSRATETPIGVRFAIGLRRTGRPGPHRVQEETRMPIVPMLKRTFTILAVGAALCAAPTPATAQLQGVVYGGTEIDTEDLLLLLLGGSVLTENPGLGFGAGVQGYFLRFPVTEDETESVQAVQPMVHVRYLWPATGAVQANIGYQFVDGVDLPEAVGAPGGAADGLVTALQGIYWGDGSRSAEGIVSQNWNAGYFWGRGRGSQRLGAGPLGIGGELVLQGTTDDDTYRAAQAGALVEFTVSPQFRLIGVVGGKTTNRDDAPSIFPYFKVEFVALPF